MKKMHNPERTFVLQHDQSDCGVACLLSMVNYYNGNSSLEKIRELSGTTKTGTSLLGLYQAANQLGFDAEGCEANIKELIKHARPVILHLLLENNLQHYVVCYQYENEKFVIGDPGKGIVQYNNEELEKVWKSKACLTLEPGENFTKAKDIKNNKLKWIKNLIKEDINILSVSIAVGIAIAVLGMVMAVFSQKLIDEILPSKDLTKLIMGIVLAVILLVARAGLSAVRQFLIITQSKDFNNRIIDRFYSTLLSLPKPFFDTRKIGELTARLNDTRRIQQVISQIAGNIVIDALIAIISIVFLCIYSLQTGIIAIVGLPLFFILVYRFNRKIIAAQKEVMVSYAQTESNYISTMQGISDIKNFNKQRFFASTNKMIYGSFQDKIFSLGRINIKLGLLSGITGVLFLGAILAYGSYMVYADNLQLGELMAILSISSSLLPSVASLALVAIPVNEAKVAFNRMFEFVSLNPEQEDSGLQIHRFESLEIKNLNFRFPGRKQLLSNINISLRKNELISIVGESGCGKSTLCQVMEKFYPRESGSILINEQYELNEISTTNWRSIVGVVPQEIHIFNGTVLDNICLANANEEAEQALKFCKKYGFHDIIETFPQSYLSIVGEEGINLSGGQKQVIALARALYKKPQLLILDEATSAMDRTTELFTLQLLERLKKEIAVVFISHRLHILHNISNCIYIIEENTIKAKGNHRELMSFNNLYSQYWKNIAHVQQTVI
ncbi:peptidase domain-containing ABC transporter [Marinifilum sp. D737]|uniref:peptidase domain-containing ABC transporter n=1 Tax=Marinifilum sp. D737 TaxID=2969628 RepID=UPI0022749D86|nr:peptidase domain-containing ABC transporter [Marinifilum sp. D737]MCY1635963.1 peptidase domain-containing ABC transporter [Marinifilum sp. D737]